ncbi:MAG: YebC/PmpR family DNA-binding transcriptional regulator [bacterium]|nr:YebC/PmpR family DNA-binding transcriptional regulator [bacterium]
MSGHSKWATIKRKKGAADAKRGKTFSKIIRELTVVARDGGGDPDGNARLRTVIEKAKAVNMPQDNITRAIKKGTGELEGTTYEESVYEGYGPNGVALIMEILTDNKNRTLSEVRHTLSKNGGNLGETGCVSWVFSKKGILRFKKEEVSEETLMEAALEAGADDIKDEEDIWEVLTDPAHFEKVKKTLAEKGLKPFEAELSQTPQNTVKLAGHAAEQMLRLMEALEDNDDVQNVYANFDIDKSEMEKLAG